MVLELGGTAPAEDQPVVWRPLAESDASGLADLMLVAYRGSVDDEGEGPDEARSEVLRTFAGAYGPMLWGASFVVEGDVRPTLLSASVITVWQGAPLLAFSLTHPQARRGGLATALIRHSARTLADQGHTRLELVVTRGNAPAERLYDKLGFRDVQQR
jgi:GNAT superfamily N-acetyltransferase